MNMNTVETSASATVVAPPPLAARTANPVDDFFGCTGTRESRHDARRVSSVSSAEPGPDALPAYSDVEGIPLPAYSRSGNEEPVTLAMYLFKFGFLFPPFWIIGALILTSKLRAPAEPAPGSADVELAWLPDKTATERAAIVQLIRRTEVKWAKRSLIALLVLCLLVALIVPIAYYASTI